MTIAKYRDVAAAATAAALIFLSSRAVAQDIESLKNQYRHGLADKRAEALLKMSAHNSPDAVEFVKKAALAPSEDREVRLAAVTALGRFGGQSAFDGVMRALGDRDDLVRRKARAIILDARNDAVFEALREFIATARNDTLLSYETLSVMAQLSADKTLPVIESLHADNDNIRYASARVIPRAGASPTAEKLLGIFLRDEMAEIRAEAAEGAAEMRIYPLIDKILPLLTDKSAKVRAAAEAALEKLADERALVYWLDAFRSPKPAIRAHSAKAVAKLGKPESLPHMFSLLDDKAPEVRKAAEEGLPRVFSPKEHVFFMLNELGSKNPLKRKTALNLLAASGDSSVVPALFSSLHAERDPAIISGYTSALKTLSSPENLSDLRAAGDSPSVNVRTAAVHALAAVSARIYPETFAVLLYRSEEEKDPAVIKEMLSAFASMKPVPYRLAYSWAGGRWPVEIRISACEFLGNHGETEAINALMPAAGHPNQEIAWRARDAVEKLVRKPADAAVLARHLDSRDKNVRLFILGTLKKYPSDEGAVHLGKINYSRADTEVRYAMIETVRALKTRAAHPLAVEALRDRSAEIRWLAAKTVAESAGDDAAGILINSLSDSSAPVREEVLKALAKNPRFEYAARIRPYLADSDPAVRKAAMEAVAFVADDEALKIIQNNLLRDQDASIRAMAADAVGRARIKQAADTLKKMAETDLYPECRRAASKALAAIGAADEKTVEIFFLLIKDADSSVREEAAAILDGIIDKSHKPYLIRALYDENARARSYALSAIARLNLYEANAELFNLAKMMRRENRAQNRELLSTLGKLLDEGDLNNLVELYELNNPELKLWVIEQTGRLKSEAAAAMTARALREENPAFRQKALESTSAAKHSAIRAAIKYIADNDPDPALRRMASEKLR